MRDEREGDVVDGQRERLAQRTEEAILTTRRGYADGRGASGGGGFSNGSSGGGAGGGGGGTF